LFKASTCRPAIRAAALSVSLALAAAGCSAAGAHQIDRADPGSVRASGDPAAGSPGAADPAESGTADGGTAGAEQDDGAASPEASTFGNPDGGAAVPVDAASADTSNPDHVVGTGTPASCTSAAVVEAVAQGGIVTFDCGVDPVTITMTSTAVMTTDTLVLDGGGLVTLSGGGAVRILEARVCQGMSEPRWCRSGPSLTLQNLSLVDADSSNGQTFGGALDGGGAVLVEGVRGKVHNVRFAGNACVPTGADPGGAALRIVKTPIGEPSYVVDSTFEDGRCANGGAISGLHADLAVYNSMFTGNQTTGIGQNHPDPNGGAAGVGLNGQPGGGLGGAIYLDGQYLDLTIAGSVFEGNQANELGGAVFFVSNKNPGTVSIDASVITGNPATEQDRWGSTPGLYLQGVEGFPYRPLTGDQVGGIVSNTTLS
jgi:hypothetical protein